MVAVLVVALTRAAIDTVDEVGRVVAAEGIDCGFAKGGVVRVARTAVQAANQRHEIAEFEVAGLAGEVTLLDAVAARQRLNATSVQGGLWYRPAARIHPARLVHGLARAVERRGVEIVEHTAVTTITPGNAGATRWSCTDPAGGAHRTGHRDRRRGRARHRGLHPRPAGRAAIARPALLAHDRHRTTAGRRVGRDRPARPRDVQRRSAHGHLRAAHRRRPDRVRRPRRALSVRLAHRPVRSSSAPTTTTGSRRRCASCCR